MRGEISKVQDDLGTTTIYVTHDQVEAMTMGHRVAVMDKGLLQQVETPQKLYDEPANLFVASFIGTPPMNLLAAQVKVEGGKVSVVLGRQELAVPDSALERYRLLASYNGRSVAMGIPRLPRPRGFRRRERVHVVAVARWPGGTTTLSPVVGVVPRRR